MTDLVKRLRDWQHVHPEDQDKPEGHLYIEAANLIEELDAEVDLLWETLVEAIRMISPTPEDILKGANIYRIVRAYHQAGGALSNDIKDALQDMKEKSDGQGLP